MKSVTQVISSLFIVAIIIIGPSASGAVQAQDQDQSLEILEKRIEKEKQKRQAAERQRQEEAKAIERENARKADLVMTSDESCSISVNGVDFGRLNQGQAQSIKVLSGEILVQCSTEDGRRSEFTDRVGAGEQKVLRIRVPPPERFSITSYGVYDRELDVTWLSTDNGRDASWSSANRFCEAMGWSLPRESQLRSLYGSNSTGTGCGNYTCKVPALFTLTDYFFWTSESTGDGRNVGVAMASGERYRLDSSHSDSSRAICVKRGR